MRINIGYITALLNFEFSKDYRYGTTLKHRIAYRVINTIASNRTKARLRGIQ